MWDVLLSGKLSAQYPTYTVTTPEVGRLLVERPGMVSKMVGVAPFEQIEKVRPQPQRDQGGEQHRWPGPGAARTNHKPPAPTSTKTALETTLRKCGTPNNARWSAKLWYACGWEYGGSARTAKSAARVSAAMSPRRQRRGAARTRRTMAGAVA